MTTIDTLHPVIEAFEAVGYAADRLFDPSEITPENVRSGQIRLLQWTSHGVEMFDVDEVNLVDVDLPAAEHAVAFGRGSEQPIDFEGALYDEIPPATQLRASANPKIILFGWREDRKVPNLTQGDVLDALGWWGSEGWLPTDTAAEMIAAFGGEVDADTFGKGDLHIDAQRIARAPTVVKRMAAADHRVDPVEGDANGHKKRRRTGFYDTLEALQDVVEDYEQ